MHILDHLGFTFTKNEDVLLFKRTHKRVNYDIHTQILRVAKTCY